MFSAEILILTKFTLFLSLHLDFKIFELDSILQSVAAD